MHVLRWLAGACCLHCVRAVEVPSSMGEQRVGPRHSSKCRWRRESRQKFCLCSRDLIIPATCHHSER
eukprot:2733586-Prymnesium_polylepis.1